MMLEKRQRSHLFPDFHRIWVCRIKKIWKQRRSEAYFRLAAELFSGLIDI
ncbi:MAG: hypothetical protein K0R28_4013 [Paenibacillus sp.]|jgi:hypothetical protein|nr:hypothetical protein [Paenibacillus sp.]